MSAICAGDRWILDAAYGAWESVVLQRAEAGRGAGPAALAEHVAAAAAHPAPTGLAGRDLQRQSRITAAAAEPRLAAAVAHALVPGQAATHRGDDRRPGRAGGDPAAATA